MNLSTLNDIYVEPALRFLGHKATGFEPKDLPTVTNQHVLGRLDTFPDLILRVRSLQAEQESFTPTDDVQREVKAFCQSAGRRLVRACTMIEGLRDLLCSCTPDDVFMHHRILVECLLLIKESLAFWKESVDAKEFYGRHARSVEVRFQYLERTLRLVLIIVDLTFPEGLRPYVVELEDVLGWPDLQEQFQVDNAASYAESKKRVRVGITAPHYRLPKRFIPYGMKKLKPYWYLNPNVYGHLQMANQCCIKKRKGTLDHMSGRGKPRSQALERW